MHKLWGKIVFGISTASLVGLYCLSFMPSALAKGNGNGNSQNNTTTSSNNGGGNGNGNSNTSTTTSSTTTSSNSGSTQSPSSTSTASSDFSSIVFNLDCVISGTVGNNSYSGSNCTNAGVSFGTLTIKQNPFDSTKVDVVIDLAGDNVHKILDVSLNYDDSKFQNNAFEVS
jgi:cytoskeletal protein RodZ